MKEIQEQQQRIRDWLSPENIAKATGKKREEIFKSFANTPQPIAYLPQYYLQYFTGQTTDNRIYSSQAYFIDHVVNHHPDINISDYNTIQDILSNPDEII